MHLPDLKGVRKASENLKDVSIVTPLNLNERLSEKLNCRIFFKKWSICFNAVRLIGCQHSRLDFRVEFFIF